MTEDLREALKEKKVVLGSSRTVKYLKMGKVRMVIVASNCPENIRKDLEQYAKMGEVKLEGFDGTANQLGVFCGKPFSISSLAIVK
jgi:large subunit ribosomal protein L30e